ncbi:MAG TPA: hypothetical protein VHZ24_18265 [Pirellulales bacterium]|jgi:hypothetical protein|nr:hypothetical protein [Pirellulales bacterium]
MSLTRPKSWLLALGLQILLVSAAQAQVQPFAPANDPTAFGVQDASIFAQPDQSLFDRGPQPNYGYFGGVEALGWSISNPPVHDFGQENATRQVYINNSATPNTVTPSFPPLVATPTATISTFASGVNVLILATYSATLMANQTTATNGGLGYTTQTQSNGLNTSWLAAPLTSGVRFDFGYVDEETNRGWLFSTFDVFDQVQSRTSNNVSAVFADGTTVAPGVTDGGTPATVYNALASYTATLLTVSVTDIIGVAGIASGTSTLPGSTTTFTYALNPLGIQYGTFDGANGNSLHQPAPTLPLLYGFVSSTAATATTSAVADDINRNGIAGANGLSTNTLALLGPNSGSGAPFSFSTTALPTLPIDYGDAVPLSLIFTTVQSKYSARAWGIEANRLIRFSEPGPVGGRWDAFGGVRYLEFDDFYNILASGGILDTTTVNTSVWNRIVGPQAGVRWTRNRGRRLSFAGEARFMAGADFQTARLNGIVGSNLTQILTNPTASYTPVVTSASYTINSNTGTISYSGPTTVNYVQTQQANNPGGGPAAQRLNQPLNLQPTTFQQSRNNVAFTPVFELRGKLVYRLFQQVNLTAGWTGTYIDGVSRASNQVNFVLPTFTLNAGPNHQGVLLNGLTLGVEINR